MTEYVAFGTSFQIESAVPGTYVPTAQVRNIGGPGMSTDAVDVSCMESTGFYRQFVTGFLDGGEVALELVFDPADPTQDETALGLLDLFNTGVENLFQIVFPDTANTIWRFAGLVTGYEPAAPHEEALMASVTIKLTGQPTFAAV